MIILRATHSGMCFGVRNAIHLAHEAARSGPLTVLGDLVHNEAVLADLARRGVQIERDPNRLPPGRRVMITAHGAAERRLESLRRKGFSLIEATCPLVHRAHAALVDLARQGFHPVVVGVRDHVEVRGLTGDLDRFDVVLTPEDIGRLAPKERFGVISQTTQPLRRVQELVQLLRDRFPESEVRWVDTVCAPTRQRQESAVELARQCDAVVVVGGRNSNNTRELVRTCESHCARVYAISQAKELRPEWFEGVSRVGLTAGTSTPDESIDAVEKWLRALAPAAARHR